MSLSVATRDCVRIPREDTALKVSVRSLVGVLLATPFVALLVRDWYAFLAERDTIGSRLAGIDYRLYTDATRRFFEGGGFYHPWQLTGTYGVDGLPILYPPQAMALFAPFLVLPAIFWWAVPILVTTTLVVRWRPQPLSWPLIAACLWWPTTSIKIVAGNPAMWMTMFLALGLIYRWPAALLIWKPTVSPFALVGLRDRRWWLVTALSFFPFSWLLPDYLLALRNFASPSGPLYSIAEIPMLLLPAVAYLGRSRGRTTDELLLTGTDPAPSGESVRNVAIAQGAT